MQTVADILIDLRERQLCLVQATQLLESSGRRTVHTTQNNLSSGRDS